MDVLRWVWRVTDWLAHGFGGDGMPYGGLVLAGLWLCLVAVVVFVVLTGVMVVAGKVADRARLAQR